MLYSKIVNKINETYKEITQVTIKNIISPSKIVHHGIQRSGTNYIHQVLLKLKAPPINGAKWIDNQKTLETKNIVKHKHFRWQKDKTTIPSFFSAYNNKLSPSSIKELNNIAGYPNDSLHIVMIKSFDKWLFSAMNWGLRNKFFSNKEDAISNSAKFALDYFAYYQFWHQMKLNSSSVFIFSIEDIQNNFDDFIHLLISSGVKIKRSNDFDGHFEKLPQSPIKRRVFFTSEDKKNILNNLFKSRKDIHRMYENLK